MILLVKKIKLYLLILKMLNNIKEEYIKCIEDPIYFIEHYILVNNEHIVLKDYQKKLLKLQNV